MKENKKAILEILKKKSKKDGKFENLVLNLALQKIDSDNFEFDGKYAETNVSEFWAETVTKAIHGKSDKYTKKVKEICKKYKL